MGNGSWQGSWAGQVCRLGGQARQGGVMGLVAKQWLDWWDSWQGGAVASLRARRPWILPLGTGYTQIDAMCSKSQMNARVREPNEPTCIQHL